MTPMIAITTSNSTNVKPDLIRVFIEWTFEKENDHYDLLNRQGQMNETLRETALIKTLDSLGWPDPPNWMGP